MFVATFIFEAFVFFFVPDILEKESDRKIEIQK